LCLLDRRRAHVYAEDPVAQSRKPECIRAETAANIEDQRACWDEASEQLVETPPWLRVFPRRVAGMETKLEIVGQLAHRTCCG
jgi:hypothetical protein